MIEAMANIAEGSGQKPKNVKEERGPAMNVSSGSEEDLDKFVRERGLNKGGSGPLTRAGFQDDILSESSDSAEGETVKKGKGAEGTWEQVKGSKKRRVTTPEQPSKGPAEERRAEGTSDEMFKAVKEIREICLSKRYNVDKAATAAILEQVENLQKICVALLEKNVRTLYLLSDRLRYTSSDVLRTLEQ
ncbi:unnamed protein product [Hermetia illucens]|uniref:Uncharacterized protein n=1 Tax=Hermetia illucens TaxID=343691 RepID=A0A7R8Z2V5_HERIL|nr:unnamed protein product [Hermetia illucens]